MRRASVVIASVALALTAGPFAVRASATSPYQQVLQVYEREGTIPSCQFTAAELQAALDGVDTYGAQYFADFTQAVQAALTAQAGGTCAAPGVSGAVSPPGAGSPVPPPPGGSLTAAGSGGIPLPLALLGGLAALVALGLGARATVRRLAGAPARRLSR